jgi:hypothetical protein
MKDEWEALRNKLRFFVEVENELETIESEEHTLGDELVLWEDFSGTVEGVAAYTKWLKSVRRGVSDELSRMAREAGKVPIM